MVINVRVVSQRKGSNPGGRCEIFNGVVPFSAYFKYCYGTHLGRSEVSSFNAHNQPIYEALTFELAKRLGLNAPNTFVLLNRERDVAFLGWEAYDAKDPSGRDFYFVSEIIPHPKEVETNPKEREALTSEIPYLDALLISDIVGRKQNYAFEQNDNGCRRLTYLDLGCSFVHAKEGHLRLAHRLKIRNAKEFKRVMKKLEGKKVISASRDKAVDLGYLVEEIGTMPIPVLNPKALLRTNNLLSLGEIEEIRKHIAQGFYDALPNFRQTGYLI